ncbi:hypothetical protein [Palleronia caenipelagi]|uniref:DUF465 domain-containing protein n=1 Tax=Palleronia caenipelagi TaxID=2489174 RepID=A0A547Q9E9_9RHOB|nr:hypothetical protein [Palleronia caenipelagi]TRD22994.1 hypothetical protein FEV53_02180 [Palleronia caenipelagi]
MGIESTIEKLDKYSERLKKGKVSKIKPSHVDKMIRKLEAKEQLLLEELAEAGKDTKRERLERKLALVREQLDRAKWLKEKISNL